MSDLPQGWIRCKAGELVDLLRGVSYDKAAVKDEPHAGYVPVLRATNIDQVLNFEALVYVPPKYVSRDQILRAGDVVVAASSGSKSVVGKAAQLWQQWSGSFGAFCMGIRPSTELNARYIGYFFQTPEYRRTASRLAAGSNINNLKREHIADLEFKLAPQKEQHRIVVKLEELLTGLDAGTTALERARANLKRYRTAVLKAAVEGRLTEKWRAAHPDVEPASKLLERILADRRRRWEEAQLNKFANRGQSPPKGWKDNYPEPFKPRSVQSMELPKGWCWAALDQLLSVVTSGSRAWSKYYDRGSCVFVMAGNVRPMKLDLSERQFVDPPKADSERDRTRVQMGDILVTIVGANTGDVCEVQTELSDHFVCQSVALLRPVAARTSGFVAAFLNAEGGGKSQFREVMYGQGRPHLGLDDIRNVLVALPPMDEQAEICSEVARQMSTAEVLEAQARIDGLRASRLRQSILMCAFEGKLVPQDPKDEPASELLSRIRVARESEKAMPSQAAGKRANGR